jgi:hypothetical protein
MSLIRAFLPILFLVNFYASNCYFNYWFSADYLSVFFLFFVSFVPNLRRYSQVKVHHSPQVSTTPAANFATSLLVLLIPVANLPPVPTAQAANNHAAETLK